MFFSTYSINSANSHIWYEWCRLYFFCICIYYLHNGRLPPLVEYSVIIIFFSFLICKMCSLFIFFFIYYRSLCKRKEKKILLCVLLLSQFFTLVISWGIRGGVWWQWRNIQHKILLWLFKKLFSFLSISYKGMQQQ